MHHTMKFSLLLRLQYLYLRKQRELATLKNGTVYVVIARIQLIHKSLSNQNHCQLKHKHVKNKRLCNRQKNEKQGTKHEIKFFVMHTVLPYTRP